MPAALCCASTVAGPSRTAAARTAAAPDGLDLAALTSYLTSAGVPLTGPLTGELISGGRSNLTYVVGDRRHNWVVRRPPRGRILAGAHDVGREYRVMAALAGTVVPVPAMVSLCADDTVLGVPFYVMERVDGTVLRSRDQVVALDRAQRARLGTALVDTLADLHDIDYEAVGLGRLGRPDGYLRRQVERWVKQYRQVRVRDLPHIEHIVATLRDGLPASGPASIVHGDFRLDNVIVDRAEPDRIAAVLDWEMATLGDPLADLATLAMFWDEPDRPYNPITAGLTAVAGFPRVADVIERYVARRELAVDDIDWYLVFAEFKLAVILEQIHARHVSGQTIGAGFDTIGDMVLVLLDSAAEKITRSPGLRRTTSGRKDER
jgi:aminoglycoside phosphotransferase (APT) family kinase protein